VTLTQVRRYALSLPESEELPHFDRTSFRVKGKIFVTARPSESCINVFVPEEVREPVLAMHPEVASKLVWGAKVIGLRIEIAKATPELVKDLVKNAWRSKAPNALIK
jgi:hypothetical protein